MFLRTLGEMKEDRDLVVYALWERGLFRNDDIGRVFGVSCSAVSHIVKEVKERIKEDQERPPDEKSNKEN